MNKADYIHLFKEACGDKCNAEYNPCIFRQAADNLAKLKPSGYIGDKGVLIYDTTLPHLYRPLYALDNPDTTMTLSNAGADTNIEPFTLYPKGSGMVALNQPEQEPVAWMTLSEHEYSLEYKFNWLQTPLHDIPLYKAPMRQKWVGLTDEDTANICMQSDVNNWHDEQVIAAVEAKLKELNT